MREETLSDRASGVGLPGGGRLGGEIEIGRPGWQGCAESATTTHGEGSITPVQAVCCLLDRRT